jgi:hypothetical protein
VAVYEFPALLMYVVNLLREAGSFMLPEANGSVVFLS